MTSNKSKRLLVEGRDDMHSVIHPMADHIQPRPNREEAWPVDIKDCNGIDGILNATIVGASARSIGAIPHPARQAMAHAIREKSAAAPARKSWLTSVEVV